MPLVDNLFGPSVTPREDQGVEFPWDQSGAIVVPLEGVAFPMFVNMTPLLSRIAQRAVGNVAFVQYGHAHRPNSFLLMASINTSATTLTVNDSSIFQNGDILEMSSGEHVEVSADPNLTNNTITVTRAMEGTAGTAITVVGGSEPTCYLIGNARTGGEEFQRGLFPKTWQSTNWVQTSQHPVEVSGIFMDTTVWQNAEGAPNPFEFGRTRQLANMMQGYSRAMYYGLGAAPTAESTKRAKTKGILKRLNEVGNIVVPSGGDPAAYTPDMLFRDLWSRISGNQDLLVFSPDWRAAMVKWKLHVVVMDMGTTEFNMDIEAFTIPTFGRQLVMFDPQLRPGTALALREEDITLRYMRLPSFFVRGRNGDAVKGDIIARMGFQVDNPELQTAVTGVTGFAAP
jgi:hypothetical protein